MTKIDFYILPQDAFIARIHFMCRLVEKAINRDHHVVIAVDDKEQATSLSEYLWSFKPESFLPHDMQDTANKAPIVLAWDQSYDQHHDIMINISQCIPNAFSQYQRVMEIVIQEKHCLTNSREHFQFYKNRDYPLQYHTI